MKEIQTIDPLKQALVDIITKATSGMEKGIAFLQDKIPEVIEQLLIWKATESFIAFISMLILSCICVVIAKKIYPFFVTDLEKYKKLKKKGVCDVYISEWYISIMIAIVALYASSFIILICAANYLDWLQIWLAPKVYLIEYAAQFMK